MSKPGFLRRMADRIWCAMGAHSFESTDINAVWEMQFDVAQQKCRACDLKSDFLPNPAKIMCRRDPGAPSSLDLCDKYLARIDELERALRPFAECFGRADETHPEDVVILDGLADEDFERAFEAMNGGK